MSKAFTSEETATDPILVRARAPLPPGVPNYVTERGLAQLRSELQNLETERNQAEHGHEGHEDEGRGVRLAALSARLAALSARIGSAVVLEGGRDAADEVRFGNTVTLRAANGQERRYQIVGVDEADARAGKIAFVSPLARALLGRRPGDTVQVETPRGEEDLEILAIAPGGAPL
jgi:transcription elongation factor GreB